MTLRDSLRRLVRRDAPSRTRALRIAIGRIAQETNALSPVRTELSDFESMHYVEGDALLAICERGVAEAPAFIVNAELTGFVEEARREAKRRGVGLELVPTLSAWAVPSGPLSVECFRTLVARLVAQLRHAHERAPLDGVFLSMHGAMGADGERDPETVILEAVRDVIGARPLAVTLDLHANLTRARVATGALFFGYHTNPHRDHAARGAQAARVLVPAMLGEIEPVVAWRSLPMLLGGSPTIDLLAPMRSIYARCRRLEREGRRAARRRAFWRTRGTPAVLAANVLMCHPWLDADVVGWSSVVIVDGKGHARGQARAHAERLADELAERCWSVRDALPPAMPGPDEAFAAARDARLARTLGAVLLADASDVVTAGAPGDSTELLRAALAHGRGLTIYVGLRDPSAARELAKAPLGSVVERTVGATLDPTRQRPLRVRGTVAKVRHEPGHGTRVRLDLCADGDDTARVHLVISEGPTFNVKPAFYRDLELRPHRADVIVVKNFFPFRIFYAPYARKTLYVKSGGTTDVDAAFTFPFDGPVHPRDQVDDWRAIDRARRG